MLVLGDSNDDIRFPIYNAMDIVTKLTFCMEISI